MIIRRRKTPKHPRRRLDVTAMREALSDGKIWAGIGIVGNEDQDSDYYDLDGEDLLVDVRLMPNEEPVTARMGLGGAGPNAGVWSLPPRGAEVALIIPEGDLAGGPIIVGVLSTGNVPDGIAANTIVIASGAVLVHDGDGGAVPLATKADVDAVADALDGHDHTYVAPGTGGSPAQTSGNPSVPSPSGTSVLKGK